MELPVHRPAERNLPTKHFDPFTRQRSLTKKYHVANWQNWRNVEAPMPGLEVFEKLCRRANDCHDSWFSHSCSWPILTPEQEWHLFVRLNYRKAKLARILPNPSLILTGAQVRRLQEKMKPIEEGIESDIDTIARCNFRIVAKRLRKYPAHAFQDVLSAAQQALVQSIHLFNPFLGNKFSTYLTSSVNHAVNGVASAQINRRQLETNLDNKTLDRETWDDTPTEMESAQEVEKLLNLLNAREQEVIRLRFGIGCERMLLKDIAKRLGKSKQRIQQNESEAMAKLRHFTRAAQSKRKPA